MTQTLACADIRGYYASARHPDPRLGAHRSVHQMLRRRRRPPTRRPRPILLCQPRARRLALSRLRRQRRCVRRRHGTRLFRPGSDRPDGRLPAHRAPRVPACQRQTRTPSPFISKPPAQPPRTPLRATREDIERWRATLAADTDLIAKLARERGWLYATMLELELGVDRGRITIPVRDDERRLIGLLRYQPWPKPGEPKMLAAAGSRRALLPHPAAEPSTQVLLVEGEPDMIAARSRGLPAIAVPGVDGWRRCVGPAPCRTARSRSSWTATSRDGQPRRRSRATSHRSVTSECSTSRPTGTTATTSLID